MDGLDLYEQIKQGLIKVNRLSPHEFRFWHHIDKDGPNHPTLGKCWVWVGCRDKLGYGYIGGIHVPERRVYRYSWQLHFGPIPDGLCVLHACDNPPCVNPSHLFLGTRTDNNLDRQRKGRHGDRKGQKNGRAKLTDGQVAEIRRRYVPGCLKNSGAALAREFGVGTSTVWRVVHGKHWRHVPCA